MINKILDVFFGKIYMTNPNLTDITLILDRSGSMMTLVKDVIGGVNSFVEDQKKQSGDCNFSLIQFDTAYEPGYSGPVSGFVNLDHTSYVPRGMTALWDAMGKAITAAGERFKKLDEEKRPGKVIFVIYTDGFENSSHEYKQDALKALIEKQRSIYKWDFVFLGANQDAVLTAKSMGIVNSMSVAATAVGTASMFTSTSNLIRSKRGASVNDYHDLSYSAEDKAKQKAEGAV